MRVHFGASVVSFLGMCAGAWGCGANSDPLEPPPPPDLAPESVSRLELPVRAYAVALGGAQLHATHNASLGDLVGGVAGLFLAGQDELTPLDDAPVQGLATAGPSTAVIATTEGVMVYEGTLVGSPLSDALEGMSVRALAADQRGLWLGTDVALYRLIDDQLIRFDEVGGVTSLSAPTTGERLTVRGETGTYLMEASEETYRLARLSDERDLDQAFALTDGTVLGVFEGALVRRIEVGEGQHVWRPQALDVGAPGATDIRAAAQDPARGAVWLASATALYRVDGPQVAVQPLPEDLSAVVGLAVDDLGAVWVDDGSSTTRVGADAAPVTWQETIATFAEANCTRCHNALGTARPLEDFETWKTDVDAILAEVESARMPLDRAPLVGGSAETIRRWKEDGLLY